ncbi:MAG: RyR domain-containing protein [Pseudomonadota bacterium]
MTDTQPEDTQDAAIELAIKTLSGDMRDALLTHIRAMETPWSKLSEQHQADKIHAAENIAKDMVRRAVNMIAEGGFPCVDVEVGKFTVDKGVKIELQAVSNTENITSLAEHGKGQAGVLILADSSEYFGERKAAMPEPDQKDLVDEAEDQTVDPKTLPDHWTDEAVMAAAEIYHERNAGYCAHLGDNSQQAWAKAPDWQKDSAIDGVLFHLEHGDAAPELSHKAWMAEKERNGWTHGEVKDAEAKTHPSMVPYDDLPESEQLKDIIFASTVRQCGRALAAGESLAKVISHDWEDAIEAGSPQPDDMPAGTDPAYPELPKDLDRREGDAQASAA